MTNSIQGLGEYTNPVVAIPRAGKIHLGEPKVNNKTQGVAGYFVLPEELKQYFSDNPTTLPIYLPSSEREEFFSQKWRRYASGERLVCHGDGVEALEISRDFSKWEPHECRGFDCPHVSGEKKNCSRKGFFWFYLRIPRVPLSGVWQIDTSGANSMRRINAQAEAFASQLPSGKIAMVPMNLNLYPETTKDASGKTRKIHVLNLSLDITPEQLAEMQRVSFQAQKMVEPGPEKEAAQAPEKPKDKDPGMAEDFNEATEAHQLIRKYAARVKELNPTYGDSWLKNLCEESGASNGEVEDILDHGKLRELIKHITVTGVELAFAQK